MAVASDSSLCRESELWRALESSAAYPEDRAAVGGGVTHLQTHISNVYLTPSRVYKFRKAVKLDFLDFSTREKRNADCLREIAINRRFAPNVYLGVAALRVEKGVPRVGPIREHLEVSDADGEIPEHCVVMRRLPDGRDVLSLLQQGKLHGAHLERVAELMARVHRGYPLAIPTQLDAQAWLERTASPIAECLSVLKNFSPEIVVRERVDCVAHRIEAFLHQHAAWFEARRQAGRFVDGHGDLHLQHIWFETDAAEPLLIDAIEFREDFRQLDPASEVAFCAMDLCYRERSRLADQFLCHYAQCSDDFDLYRVVDFFLAYRALVRAKVAALASAQKELAAPQREAAAQSARRHLDLAAEALRLRVSPGIVVMTGIVGTGKSSAAKIVAEELGGVLIASDRVRKHLAGVAATTRLSDGSTASEAYSTAMTERVYRGLFERAQPVIDSGRMAILDAVFAKRAQRELAREFARQRGIAVYLVETHCAAPLVIERLRERKLRDDNPSDAGPEFYATSVAGYEATSDWPEETRIRVDTEQSSWPDSFRPQVKGFFPTEDA